MDSGHGKYNCFHDVKGVIMSLALHYWMGIYITAQGCRLRNDLLCVEWDVKLYNTIPYLSSLHL